MDINKYSGGGSGILGKYLDTRKYLKWLTSIFESNLPEGMDAIKGRFHIYFIENSILYMEAENSFVANRLRQVAGPVIRSTPVLFDVAQKASVSIGRDKSNPPKRNAFSKKLPQEALDAMKEVLREKGEPSENDSPITKQMRSFCEEVEKKKGE